MNFTIFTLFPDFFTSPLQVSLVGKAIAEKLLHFDLVDFRLFTQDRHRTVDDTPYGGGPGMLLKPEPIAAAFDANPLQSGGRRVYLTPWGKPLTHERVIQFATLPQLQILCGRYEGVDERVIDNYIDDCVSVGDFVLAGGEAAALVLIEAVARYVPGVLGEPESLVEESFAAGLLEGPQYTRPASWRGLDVPDVLISGDHGKINAWKQNQALKRTKNIRPDLLDD